MENYNLDALKAFEVPVQEEVKNDVPVGTEAVIDDTKKDEAVIDDVNKDDIVDTKKDKDDKEEEDSTPDPYDFFVEQLGLTDFKVTDDIRNKKFEGLVEIAKHQISAKEAELAEYKNNQELVAYREHLAQGGTLQTYKEIVSLVNEYEGVEVTDENAEDLAKYFLKEVQGIEDEEEVQSLIDSKKNKGTLNEFVEKKVNTAKANRAEEIEEKQNQFKEEADNRKKEEVAYFQSIESAFDKVSLPKEILSEVKKLSLPDKQGSVPMFDIFNQMTPEQTVIMNTFAYQLSKGLPIEYKPIGTKKNNLAADLLEKVAGKTQPIDKSLMTLDDLKEVARKNK